MSLFIKLKTCFAIGAAVDAPDPPCSIMTEIEYSGFLDGIYPTKSAWSLFFHLISFYLKSLLSLSEREIFVTCEVPVLPEKLKFSNLDL